MERENSFRLPTLFDFCKRLQCLVDRNDVLAGENEESKGSPNNLAVDAIIISTTFKRLSTLEKFATWVFKGVF